MRGLSRLSGGVARANKFHLIVQSGEWRVHHSPATTILQSFSPPNVTSTSLWTKPWRNSVPGDRVVQTSVLVQGILEGVSRALRHDFCIWEVRSTHSRRRITPYSISSNTRWSEPVFNQRPIQHIRWQCTENPSILIPPLHTANINPLIYSSSCPPCLLSLSASSLCNLS